MEEKSSYQQRAQECMEYALEKCAASQETLTFRTYQKNQEKSIERKLYILDDNKFKEYIHYYTEKKPSAFIYIDNCYVKLENPSFLSKLWVRGLDFHNSLIHINMKDTDVEISFFNCDIDSIRSSVKHTTILNSICDKCDLVGRTIIRDCKFNSIYVYQCESLKLKNSIINSFSIETPKSLSKECKMMNVSFGWAIWKTYNLNFTSNNIHFHNIKFEEHPHHPENWSRIASFRSLKKACKDAEYEHGVILFHGYELESYYNAHLKKEKWTDWLLPKPDKDLPEKISHWIHKGFTDYGRDVLRPFFCLAYLFILAAWVGFAHYDLAPRGALLLSFKQSVGPMAFALNTDFWKELKLAGPDFIGFFHIITSSLIWFLIIFMIRRRFKI